MFIILAAIAFLYAYLSYQDSNMMSFYIALSIGAFFISFMIYNIIQVTKEKKEKENKLKAEDI